MSLDDDLEKEWFKLNELEQLALAKDNERPWRDVDDRPWTDEDRAATHRIVQEMSDRLARIELRQAVLFRASDAVIRKTNTFYYVAIGVLASIVLRWLYRVITQ